MGGRRRLLPLYALPLVLHTGRLPHLIVALGLPDAGKPAAALAAGALSALVIARVAHIERDVGLAVVAIGAVAASGTTAWIAARLAHDANVLAPAAAFVVVELLALAVFADEFWRRPIGWIATGAEIVAGLAAISAIDFVLHVGDVGTPRFVADRVTGIAYGFLAIGSLLAAVRYSSLRGDAVFWHLCAGGAGVFAIVAVEMTTTSTLAVAGALLAVGGALLLARHPVTDVTAIGALLFVPGTADAHSRLAFPFAAAAAALIVWNARRIARRELAAVHVGAAVALLALGGHFSVRLIDPFFVVLTFVAATWIAAVAVDDRELSIIPRFAALASLTTSFVWAPNRQLTLALVLTGLFVFDAIRTSDRLVAFGLVVPAVVAVADLARIAHLDVAYTGVVVCVASAVWAGLSVLASDRWRDPLRATAALGIAAGLALAAVDPVAFGIALISSGGVALGAGLLDGRKLLAHSGGLAVVAGTLVELGAHHVSYSEAYVAPIALYLVIAGAAARRADRDVSSWSAYAPAVALLGSTAMLERVAGGPGWHDVVAGAVGVAAVSAGGWRRLAGPLFTGTALIGAVVGLESLAVAATVPTWAWLATGGSALLATGIALERKETTPMAAGRRVVDVISTNFT